MCGNFCLQDVRTDAYTVPMPFLELESPPMQELDVAKIRQLREDRKLTQVQAAAAAGMSVSRWNDIEAGGRRNVTIDTLATIAAALGVDARELLTPSAPKRKGK